MNKYLSKDTFYRDFSTNYTTNNIIKFENGMINLENNVYDLLVLYAKRGDLNKIKILHNTVH